MKTFKLLTFAVMLFAAIACSASSVRYTAETIRPDSKVERLTILDFNATWCGPCRNFAPAFEAAEKQYAGSADFISIDVDNYGETAEAFGVQAIPMVVFMYPDGTSTTYVGTGDLLPESNFMTLVATALKKGSK